MKLLSALEAEKLTKQKWKQYCGTPCRIELMSKLVVFPKMFVSKKFEVQTKFFFFEKNASPQKILVQKMLVQRFIFVPEFFRPKNLLPKIFLPKQFLVHKNLSSSKNFGYKKIWVQKSRAKKLRS